MQSLFIDIDGPVHYLDFGGDGSPIICVHGATACAATWAGVAEKLAGNHRVIAPDLLGHGRTPLQGRRPSVAGDQQLLDRLMEELGLDSAVFVSMTRGGLVALQQARERPDRVAGLVLNEPAVASLRHPPPANLLALMALTTVPSLAQKVAGRLFKIGDGAAPMIEQWLKITCAHPELVARDEIDLMEDSARHQLQQRKPLLGWALVFRELAGMLFTGRIARLYEDVAAPAMIVFGRDSITASAESISRLARSHPSWRLELLDGVGHPPLEAPETLAELVESWLRVSLK